ncbi:MAG: methyl-accepting chemotaxis protein [Treponema sp.]|nr:methyl-accepting chemotaxis protein [Treponema sp.]
MKIGFKLTAIMVVLSIFSVGAIGITLLVRSSGSLSNLSESYAYSKAHDSGLQVEMYLEPYWDTVKTASSFLELYQDIGIAYRRSFINKTLQVMLEDNPRMLAAWTCWEPNTLEGSDIEYAGTEGSYANGRFAPYWFRSGNNINLDLLVDFDTPGDGDYYLLARNSGKMQLLEPYDYVVDGKVLLITSIAAPIKSSNGRVIGVVGVDIGVERIQEISQENKPYENAEPMVITNDGIIVGHYERNRIGRNFRETERVLAGDNINAWANAIRNGEEHSFINYYERHETDTKVIIVPITVGDSETPWSYAVGIMMNTVMKPVNDMIGLSIFIIIAVLAVVIVISVFLSRTISKPLAELALTLKEIAQGEGDLTHEIVVASKDEVGDVSKYFNETLARIKGMVITIKKEARILSDIGNDLSSDMNETAAAVNEINANVQSIKTRILSQSASVSETHATMDQVVVNINKLNGHVESQSHNISLASSAIEQMVANTRSVTDSLIKNSENVKALREASEVGRTGLQDVSSDIQEIARESEGLLEINAVMESIASQTNLLSMNAAIEAAHAGDVGKGFAVVADEIRKLAESSNEQSKTTGAVLKRIKDCIDQISRSTDNVLNKFEAIDSGVNIVVQQEENIRNAMEEQEVGSKQILQGIANVNEITQAVNSGSQQMLEGSKEVIRESEGLEKQTQEISMGISEMANGAEQINIAIHHINELSVKNRENIYLLLNEVARFKVEK